MPIETIKQPIILSISSLDPTGSAGLHADIETAASLGCHVTSAVSAVVIRDTQAVKDIHILPVLTVIEQTRALLEDCDIKIIKIGFLGSVEHIQAVHSVLIDYQHIPVVLDPVVCLCTDGHIDEYEYIDALATLLIPHARVITPSAREARLFSGHEDLDDAGNAMLSNGCQSVLISDSHSNNEVVVSSYYRLHRETRHYSAPRAPESLHGLGSTLATAIACGLAHGVDTENAIKQAHNFAASSAAHAFRIGMGRSIPGRFHWCYVSNNKKTQLS